MRHSPKLAALLLSLGSLAYATVAPVYAAPPPTTVTVRPVPLSPAGESVSPSNPARRADGSNFGLPDDPPPTQGDAGSPGTTANGSNNAQNPSGSNNARTPNGNNNAQTPDAIDNAQDPKGSNRASTPGGASPGVTPVDH